MINRWNGKNWYDIRDQAGQEISAELNELLDCLDSTSGGKVIIHRLTDEDADRGSQHRFGRAADLHIGDLHVVDQYLLVERLDPGGLGIYGRDVWKMTPGLHVDVRVSVPAARWACKMVDGKREYVALDKEYFEHVLGLD
jgi:uncharacterized protein YcbK (DUF882 family)